MKKQHIIKTMEYWEGILHVLSALVFSFHYMVGGKGGEMIPNKQLEIFFLHQEQ